MQCMRAGGGRWFLQLVKEQVHVHTFIGELVAPHAAAITMMQNHQLLGTEMEGEQRLHIFFGVRRRALVEGV